MSSSSTRRSRRTSPPASCSATFLPSCAATSRTAGRSACERGLGGHHPQVLSASRSACGEDAARAPPRGAAPARRARARPPTARSRSSPSARARGRAPPRARPASPSPRSRGAAASRKRLIGPREIAAAVLPARDADHQLIDVGGERVEAGRVHAHAAALLAPRWLRRSGARLRSARREGIGRLGPRACPRGRGAERHEIPGRLREDAREVVAAELERRRRSRELGRERAGEALQAAARRSAAPRARTAWLVRSGPSEVTIADSSAASTSRSAAAVPLAGGPARRGDGATPCRSSTARSAESTGSSSGIRPRVGSSAASSTPMARSRASTASARQGLLAVREGEHVLDRVRHLLEVAEPEARRRALEAVGEALEPAGILRRCARLERQHPRREGLRLLAALGLEDRPHLSRQLGHASGPLSKRDAEPRGIEDRAGDPASPSGTDPPPAAAGRSGGPRAAADPLDRDPEEIARRRRARRPAGGP